MPSRPIRRKARVACTSCRVRKTGCDGGRPSCSTCIARGVADECHYQGKQNPHEIRQPIRNSISTTPTTGFTSIPIPRETTFQPLSFGFNSHSINPLQPNLPVPPVHGRSRSEGNESTFGPFSNSSFIKQIDVAAGCSPEKSTNTLDGGVTDEQQSSPDSSTGYDFTGDDLAQGLDHIAVPHRKLADALMQAYWNNVHSFMPVIHKPTFLQAYNELWQPATCGQVSNEWTRNNIVFHAVLNVMFALGSQRCDCLPLDRKMTLAAKFYTHSLRLISVDTLAAYTTEIVQLLLLRTLYLLDTANSAACWSVCGASIRAAQALGLHMAKSGSTQLRREMNRRIWYGLLILDRFAAASFGWPVHSFNTDRLPLPEEIDDEFLLEEGIGQQPENVPSSISCFCHYAQLCVFICTDILQRLYSDIEENSNNSSVGLYSRYLHEVPELCSRIDNFLESLPFHLKASESSLGMNGLFQAQAQFLEERTLYVRLLLLRPSLVNSIKLHGQQNNDNNLISAASLLRGNAKDMNLLCVSTAYAVIDALHRNMRTLHYTTAWHSVRMTFGSAIVIVAASLIPDLTVSLEQVPSRSSWDKVLEILSYYKLQDPSSQQAIETLLNYRTKFSTLQSKASLDDFILPGGDALGLSLDLPALDENLMNDLSASLVNDSFALDGFY